MFFDEIEGYKDLFNLIEKVIKPGYTVLDVGCGDGDVLKFLEEEFKIEGVGIDPFCFYHRVGKNIKCIELSGENIDKIKEKFDIIYSINSLHHLNNHKLFLDKIKKVLKRKGFLILVDWKKGYDTGVRENYFSLEEIEGELIRRGIKIVESGTTVSHWYILGKNNGGDKAF
ncbi:MAG: hypothetical protein DRI28_01330 [Caldiserica bacterium]|nr:MAG: hypothetical protein DRI28_01330 [Caldisericota bacterium]